MSYLTRHFQMRGGIVGSMPNHTAREFMHKKLHGVGVPRKALIAYRKAVIGSTAVREHVTQKLNFIPATSAQPIADDGTRWAAVSIGSTHANGITVTGFARLNGQNMVCYTQRDIPLPLRMSVAEFVAMVRP